MSGGTKISVRLGDKLARAVSAWAKSHGARTSEAVRILLAQGLRRDDLVRVREHESAPSVNQEALRELTRVGVNLNQAVRQINKSGAVDFELVRLRDDLTATAEQIRVATRRLGVHDDTQSS